MGLLKGDLAPAAASNSSVVEVVARGDDDRIARITRPVGGDWPGQWSPLDGPVAVSNPTLAVNHDGRMEIFIVGSDGNVYHNSQDFPGGSFTGGFISLGGFPSGSDIAVGRNSDGRLQIFVRTGVNSLDQRSQVVPGG
jgi:hypothetical protein